MKWIHGQAALCSSLGGVLSKVKRKIHGVPPTMDLRPHGLFIPLTELKSSYYFYPELLDLYHEATRFKSALMPQTTLPVPRSTAVPLSLHN